MIVPDRSRSTKSYCPFTSSQGWWIMKSNREERPAPYSLMGHADPLINTVGLVGGGELFKSILEIVSDPAFNAPVPGLAIMAWAKAPLDYLEGDEANRFDWIQKYPDSAAMFAEQPDLDFVCCLDEDEEELREMRRLAPAATTVVSAQTVRRFCAAFKSELLPVNILKKLRGNLMLLATTIDQSDDEILVVDNQGTVIDLNNKIMETEGGKKEDYIGRNWSALRKNLYGDQAGHFLRMVLEIGCPVNERYTSKNLSGQMQNYRISVVPLKDESGRVQYVIITRKNITRKLLLEERLRQSQRLALVGELSAQVAHEIRNPLMSIGGFARRLRQSSSLGAADREKAVIIQEECRRLEEVLKSVLNFASHNQKTDGDADVNAVTAATVDLMKGSAGSKINFKLSLADNLPKAAGNEHVLKQCLINLVKNSMEALEAGGLIQIRTRYADGVVYLEVEDNGPGIPDEIRDEVYKPFFSTKTGGTGLGLSITRKLVGGLGGRLYIVSRPGAMTLVSLALPPIFVPEKSCPQTADRPGGGMQMKLMTV